MSWLLYVKWVCLRNKLTNFWREKNAIGCSAIKSTSAYQKKNERRIPADTNSRACETIRSNKTTPNISGYSIWRVCCQRDFFIWVWKVTFNKILQMTLGFVKLIGTEKLPWRYHTVKQSPADHSYQNGYIGQRCCNSKPEITLSHWKQRFFIFRSSGG